MSRRQVPFVDNPHLTRPVAFRRALRQYLFRSFAMSPEKDTPDVEIRVLLAAVDPGDGDR